MLKAVQKYSDDDLVFAIETEKDINPAILYLYQQHAEAISSFIASRGGSTQDGEDIFQEAVVTFINLVKNKKYRKEASLRTFLIAVSKNIWFNEIRKRQSTGNRERIYEASKEVFEEDISHQIGDLEMKKQFRELLNRLGEPCRKLLLLFYYEDMPMKEIVRHLPYENEQVVRNKKYKCLKQLTTMVQEHPTIGKEIK
jgi:RNA polymerase sigma factor (sigma-70 family)